MRAAPIQKKIKTSRYEELLSRGVEKVIERKNLLNKLKSGKKLRIKLGIDPTGPKIHIGRAAQFWKLRAFQELGHKIVLIIGDFTAQIGDASDKTAMRKPLTETEVKKNMKDYKKQFSKILDMGKTEIHYNSEWLNKLNFKEALKLAMHFTAQQMIQRRNFKERWDNKKPIGIHELFYPILQGYDSVNVRADVEIGGTDQLFNLKIGREMQRIFHQPPQDIVILKMLYGLDGRKMSTSWGNVVNILDTSDEIYGKIMSMKDKLIGNYFEICTNLPLQEIEEYNQKMATKKINPKDVKAKLAKAIVQLYYGKEKALSAEKNFKKVFVKKEIPSKISVFKSQKKSISILDLLVKSGLASSKSKAKRLILQKGIKISGKLQNGWKENIKIGKGLVLQAGKRKFVKIIAAKNLTNNKTI